MAALKEFFSPEIIWFILGLAMLLSEFIMPRLIIAFFGFGAWVVAILCMIIPGISLVPQLCIFIISSVVNFSTGLYYYWRYGNRFQKYLKVSKNRPM